VSLDLWCTKMYILAHCRFHSQISRSIHSHIANCHCSLCRNLENWQCQKMWVTMKANRETTCWSERIQDKKENSEKYNLHATDFEKTQVVVCVKDFSKKCQMPTPEKVGTLRMIGSNLKQ
jgi:hypothetical protein